MNQPAASGFSAADHAHMASALRLAENGLLTTTPNPRVACLLVRDGQVVGQGWHQRAGEAHAEIHALQQAGQAARGATAYVTLEPCSHHGRTPPCADALIAAGVTRVVAAMRDPNPLVAGRGLARLQAAGIETACGLLEAEAVALNIGFVTRMTRSRPWVRVKVAASLDGRTALANGSSQWITGPAARQDGHRWRARACAILTGIGTVRADDPRLTVREVATPRQPLRVVVDSRAALPLSARLLDGAPLLVACTDQAATERQRALAEKGAEIWVFPESEGQVDLAALLGELAGRGINEVHVEAGSRLQGALLAGGLVDELLFYLAPCLIGHSGRGMFDLPEITALSARCRLTITEIRQMGDDIRLLARPVST